MRRLLVLSLFALLALVTASPAGAASATVVDITGAPAHITAGQRFTLNVTITQPANVPAVDLAAADLALMGEGDFTITDVAASPAITPAETTELPSGSWAGTLDLADDTTTTFAVTLRAPAAARDDAVVPFTVTVGGQPEAAPAVTASASAVIVVSTRLQLVAQSPEAVFPTGTAQVSVIVTNASDLEWTDPVVISLALPSGLSIVEPPLGVSDTTWTIPASGAPLAGQSDTRQLSLAIASGTSAGLRSVAASEPSSATATASVRVAVIPQLSIAPQGAPLIVGGEAATFTASVVNSAAVSTGPFDIDVAIPAGLQLVSANAGAGNTFTENAAGKTWTVTQGPGDTAYLQLVLKATAVPASGDELVLTPKAFGMPPKSTSVAAVTSTADPVVKLAGSFASVFPGKTTTVQVFLQNASDADFQSATTVNLTLDPSLLIMNSPAGLTGTVWTVPALAAHASATLELTVKVIAGAAPGAHTIKAKPVGGAEDSFAVTVAPNPEITFTKPAQLVEGGPSGIVTVKVRNNASVQTSTLVLDVSVPAPLRLDDAEPAINNQKWAIGKLDPFSEATITLEVSATASGSPGSIEVYLSDYDQTVRSTSITIKPKVVVLNPVVTLSQESLTAFPGEETATQDITVRNASNETWGTGVQVTLAFGAGISVVGSPSGLSGNQWNIPGPVLPNDTRVLSLKFKTAAGSPAGSSLVTVSPSGGTPKTFPVVVAATPQVSVTPLDAPLIAGGDSDVLVVTVVNSAPIPATALGLSVKLPAGLELVRAAPLLDGSGTWNIGTLAAAPETGSSAVLRLTVRGTAVGERTVGVQLTRFGATQVSQVVTVNPAPVVVPETTPAVTPPADVPTPPVMVPDPPPAPPAPPVVKDLVSIDLGEPNRRNFAYTYRGEVRYRTEALTKQQCSKTAVTLVVWKLKGSRTVGKAQDRVKVGLVFLRGHCLFGTRYNFFKKYKGKHYRIDIRAQVKTALPVAGGTSRIPAPATVVDAITVGKG